MELQAICCIFVVIFGVQASAQGKLPLKLESTTPLPGFSGDFDHFAVDLGGNRLFLAAEEHKTVEFFDLHTGKRLQSITGFEEPHAMLYLQGVDQLLVTDGNEEGGMVRRVNGKDYNTSDAEELISNCPRPKLRDCNPTSVCKHLLDDGDLFASFFASALKEPSGVVAPM